MAASDGFFANENYEGLRAHLVSYLRLRDWQSAEDLAQESILRLIENCRRGAVVRNLQSYLHGIAQNVRLESARGPQAIPLTPLLAEEMQSHQDSDHAELLDRCLTRCLKRLSAEERRIIKVYYEGSGQMRIKSRRNLAKSLGITQQALRQRAHEIRVRLGRCIEKCAERDQEI